MNQGAQCALEARTWVSYALCQAVSDASRSSRRAGVADLDKYALVGQQRPHDSRGLWTR